MFLRDVHVRSHEYLVVDSAPQRPVEESLEHAAVSQGEGVGQGALEELGCDVGLGLVLLLAVQAKQYSSVDTAGTVHFSHYLFCLSWLLVLRSELS